MTELEKIERAKMYMDKLANGIDPISDKEAPENDVINNVRLSRCFFYVSDILCQVIDNGGVIAQKKSSKPAKTPFSITLEKRLDFDYSDIPILISDITRRINALSEDENMTQMKHGSITGWLIDIGMLELSQSISGQRTKIPTSAGNEIGIYSETRMGMNGPYTVVLYNKSAQQFVVDNLDAITERELEVTKHQKEPWSQAHDECLVDLFKKGVPESEIAVTLKRTTSAIRARLKKLGYHE